MRGSLDSEDVADYFRMKQDAGVGGPTTLKGELGAARAPAGKDGIILHNFMVRCYSSSSSCSGGGDSGGGSSRTQGEKCI